MAARVGGDDQQRAEELLRLEVSRGKDTNHVSFTVREPPTLSLPARVNIPASRGQSP